MMHVAICDDNVADRKQSERLLQRESDKRLAAKGNFYIDSYGNAESLLSNPMRYDVYFVDMCKGSVTGIDILNSLLEQGINSPVVLCCSDINYRKMDISEENLKRVIFMDKPIQTSELASIIDKAQEITNTAEPFIELREEAKTHYVKEADILYCIEKGHHVLITFTNGQTLSVCTSAYNLCSQWDEIHETFFMPSGKVIVNGRHIKKTAFHRITMKDGRSFFAAGRFIRYAKYLKEKYQ